MFSNSFFENHALCETMSKNVVEPEWAQTTLPYVA